MKQGRSSSAQIRSTAVRPHGAHRRRSIVGSPAAVRSLRLTLAVAVTAAALIGATTALATTGPTPVAFPPKYKISKRQARPLIGVYKMRGRTRRLISAGLAQRFNEAGYFQGSLAVYQYNKRGMESSWVGTTYEYHVVHGKVHIDVFSPNGQGTPLLARMVLRAHGKRLTGVLRQIHPHISAPERISFVRVRR